MQLVYLGVPPLQYKWGKKQNQAVFRSQCVNLVIIDDDETYICIKNKESLGGKKTRPQSFPFQGSKLLVLL